MDKTANEIREELKRKEMLKRNKRFKEMEYEHIISLCKVKTIQDIRSNLQPASAYYEIMLYNSDGTKRSIMQIMEDVKQVLLGIRKEISEIDCELFLLDIGEVD